MSRLHCRRSGPLRTADAFLHPQPPSTVNGPGGDGVSQAPDDVDAGSQPTAATGDCREIQYPCTRVYSVQKPVKQCISYLCVTSVRRVYMLNKEICTRIMCKEHEVMEDERCRQQGGIPLRRDKKPDPPEEKPTSAEGN